MDEQAHIEWHEAAQQAAEAHRRQRIADNILTEPKRFPCLLAPGDTIEVSRLGAPGLASSFVQVVAISHGEPTPIGLTPIRARQLAAALLDAADEVDPFLKGTARDDKGADA